MLIFSGVGRFTAQWMKCAKHGKQSRNKKCKCISQNWNNSVERLHHLYKFCHSVVPSSHMKLRLNNLYSQELNPIQSPRCGKATSQKQWHKPRLKMQSIFQECCFVLTFIFDQWLHLFQTLRLGVGKHLPSTKPCLCTRILISCHRKLRFTKTS